MKMSTAAGSSRCRPVAQGGAMFSTARVPVSKETQELLKVMMNESKLTNFQQRQLKDTLRSGEALPLSCNPTTSSPGRGDRQKKASSKKPKQPSKQGLRTKETIEGMVVNASEPDYRPAAARYNSSKEKHKLQNVMAFGTDIEPIRVHPAHRVDEGRQKEEEVDRFDEILQEITERKEFLDEMESLGQGQQYRGKIMTEISQRIHELEVLDKQRCKEFTAVLDAK